MCASAALANGPSDVKTSANYSFDMGRNVGARFNVTSGYVVPSGTAAV